MFATVMTIKSKPQRWQWQVPLLQGTLQSRILL